MISKKLFITGLFLASAFSLTAEAKSLNIINNTDFPSSAIINNGSICSNRLPGGMTPAHSSAKVEEFYVNIACVADHENCKANIYLSSDCTGTSIGTVIFSTASGAKSVTMTNSQYEIIANNKENNEVEFILNKVAK